MALVTKYADNIPVYWADTEDFIALARAYSTVLDRLFEDVASCFEAAINPATMARVELIELLDRLGYDDVRYYTTDELRALYVDIITTRRVMTEAAFAKHLQEACPSGIVVKLEVTDGTLNILPESPEQIVVYISVDRGGRTCASTECSSDCPCGGAGGCGGDTSCGLVYVVAYATHLDYPRRDDDGNVLDWAFSYDSLARRIVDSFPASVRLMLDALLDDIPLGVQYAAVPSIVIDCYGEGKKGVKTKYAWGGTTDGQSDFDIISAPAIADMSVDATLSHNYRAPTHVESAKGSAIVEGFAEVGTSRTSWSELRGEAILRTGQRGFIFEGDIKGTELPPAPNNGEVSSGGWENAAARGGGMASERTLSPTYTPPTHVESVKGSAIVDGFAEVGTARTSWSDENGYALLTSGERGYIVGDEAVSTFTMVELSDILSSASVSMFATGCGMIETYEEIAV